MGMPIAPHRRPLIRRLRLLDNAHSALEGRSSGLDQLKGRHRVHNVGGNDIVRGVHHDAHLRTRSISNSNSRSCGRHLDGAKNIFFFFFFLKIRVPPRRGRRLTAPKTRARRAGKKATMSIKASGYHARELVIRDVCAACLAGLCHQCQLSERVALLGMPGCQKLLGWPVANSRMEAKASAPRSSCIATRSGRHPQ